MLKVWSQKGAAKLIQPFRGSYMLSVFIHVMFYLTDGFMIKQKGYSGISPPVKECCRHIR